MQTLEVPLLESISYGEPVSADSMEKRPDHLEELKTLYEKEGTVRTNRIIFITLIHEHPHILFMQPHGTNILNLPGGFVTPGLDEEEGTRYALQSVMFFQKYPTIIYDPIATWYRPHFTANIYPYLPVHLSNATEVETWYIGILEPGKIAICAGYDLISLPFYELIQSDKYGIQFSSIPSLLSRFHIIEKKQEQQEQQQ